MDMWKLEAQRTSRAPVKRPTHIPHGTVVEISGQGVQEAMRTAMLFAGKVRREMVVDTPGVLVERRIRDVDVEIVPEEADHSE